MRGALVLNSLLLLAAGAAALPSEIKMAPPHAASDASPQMTFATPAADIRPRPLAPLRGGEGVAPGPSAPATKAPAVASGGAGSSNKWAPSAASDLHDSVNIAVLFMLGAGAIAAIATNHGDLHWALTISGFVYIAFDSLWLFLQPHIVKSPGMVGAHHIATLLVLLDPLLQPRHRAYTSACLLVEVNTLLLLLRRKFSYSPLVELPFIVTWIGLRNIWYPFLMGFFFLCYQPQLVIPMLPSSLDWLVSTRSSIESGEPVPMLGVSWMSWAAVCIFQFHWTFQLFGAHPWIWGKRRPQSPDGKDKKYL